MEVDISDIEEALYQEKVREYNEKDAEVRETLKQLQAEAEVTYQKIFALIQADKREVLRKNRNRAYPRVEEIGELMDEFIRMNDEQIEKLKNMEQQFVL